MGLFGGSFGTGLVTGLASSIDRSLQVAMDKREKEMSRARQFWETRQAQKMDLADEHDRRAKKALDRFINEFDGDVAKGLAAYKAVGGSVDDAESYLAELKATRDAGISYNIQDKFKFDNIDLSQFTDLSREDALGAVRMEVPELNISMTDTSGLSKIGLGLKDVGKGISEKVNEMIPPRTFEAVEGLEAASFDSTGLKTGVEFAMRRDQFNASMQANSLDIKNQIKFNIIEINKLGDSPEDEAERQRLIKENEALFTVYDRFAEIDNRGKGGLSTSTMATNYSTRMDTIITDNNYGTVGNQASIVVDGEVITGPEATKKYNELKLNAQAQYIQDVLLNEDGTFKSSKAEDMMSLLSIPQAALELAMKNINARKEEVTKEDDVPPKGDEPPKTETKPVDTGDTTLESGAGVTPEPVVKDDLPEYTVGTQGIVVKGADAMYDFIKDNPMDYLDGVIQNNDTDFVAENASLYTKILEAAKSGASEEQIKKIDAAIGKVSEVSKTVDVSTKARSAMRVVSLPESMTITNVTELPDQKGQYLYEGTLPDGSVVNYVSSVTPDKAAELTGG